MGSTCRACPSRWRCATATTSRVAVELDPVPRRAGGRRPAGHARGDLHRAARRRRARPLPLGLEGKQAHRRSLARHRGRPHLAAPVAPHSRSRERADPRPLRRRRDGELCHPRPRPGRRGARRRRARDRGRPARRQLPRQLRLTVRPSSTRASRRALGRRGLGRLARPRRRRHGSPGSTCRGTSRRAGRSISSSGSSVASTRISSSESRPIGSTRWRRHSASSTSTSSRAVGSSRSRRRAN